MVEALLKRASVLKKILESIKDLVSDADLDCSPGGISLQAMDNSHVSLVALKLNRDGFDKYKCDRNTTLSMNLVSFFKIIKCAGNNDTVTLKATNSSDSLTVLLESPNQERFSEFQMRLINLDTDHLSIPDTDYSVVVKMPSVEFQRVCRDLSQFGDSVNITCTKSGIKFSTNGDLGTAATTLCQTANVDKPDEAVTITMQSPVTLTFALRYLNFFTKATALSPQVTLSVSSDTPLVVEYDIEDLGFIKYYLAPKIEDTDDK